MSVPAPRKPKPSSADEIARVLRVYDILADELTRRMTPKYVGGHPMTFLPDTRIDYGPISYDILSVADRIAARTED